MFQSLPWPFPPSSPSANGEMTAANWTAPALQANGMAPALEFWMRATTEAANLNAEYWTSLSRCRTPVEAAEVVTEFTQKAMRLTQDAMSRAGATMNAGGLATDERAAEKG